jgi:hypothetical protein
MNTKRENTILLIELPTMPGVQPQHWKHPAMKILYQGLRKERLLQSSFAGLLLVLAILGTGAFFPGVLGWISFVLLLAAIYWLLGIQPQQDALQHPFAKALTEEPERIVWVYSMITQMSPYGFRFARKGILYLKLDSGEELSLPLPPDKLKLISRFLNRVLPHATFGYDPEKAQRYQKAPESLRRPGKRSE